MFTPHQSDRFPRNQRRSKLTRSRASDNQLNGAQSSDPAAIIQRAQLKIASLTPSDIAQLQRTIGNAATQRVLSGSDYRISMGTKANYQQKPPASFTEKMADEKSLSVQNPNIVTSHIKTALIQRALSFKDFEEHIFIGEWDKEKKHPTGYHSKKRGEKSLHEGYGDKTEYDYGIYHQNVRNRKDNKKIKTGGSTFFPDKMEEAEIKEAIEKSAQVSNYREVLKPQAYAGMKFMVKDKTLYPMGEKAEEEEPKGKKGKKKK